MQSRLFAPLLVFILASAASAGQVSSRHEVTLYGHVQGDVIFSDQAPADRASYTVPNTPTDSRGDLNFTAQNTRLGVDFKVPAENDWTVTGKIEGDFANNPNTSNPTPRLRHAWVSVDRPSFGLMAGQNWLLFAPRNPTVLNGGSLGRSGNVWGRFPQVRATARFAPFKIEAAVMKMTSDNNTALAHTLTEEPRYQARLSWKGTSGAEIGLSGDIGKHGLNTGKVELAARSNGAAIDFNFPISRLTLSGEVFTARNIQVLMGSAGVVPTTSDSKVNSVGGFANLNIKLDDRLGLDLGYAGEHLDAKRIAAGQIERNETIYGLVTYKLTRNTSLLFEYERQRTEYKAVRLIENNRYQFAARLTF
jgi:hypothetical protein